MSANINSMPDQKRIAMVASNPAVSAQTGWPIGFWWSEVTHPYWEFKEQGYDVEIFSPDGGPLQADSFSDPEDESQYSAGDLISLGFKKSAKHMVLIEKTQPISTINVDDFDGIFLSGGQGPMYTFYENESFTQAVHTIL